MRKRSTLERKMLSYFGLIAAASLLVTLEFVWAIQAATPSQELFSGCDSSSVAAVHSLVQGMEWLRSKALLMCAVQAVVTLIVLIMFMRRITGPLQQMVEGAAVISEGDLSRTINVRTRDEIGLLAETINGLTSNIQEIVAFGQSTESSLRASLDGLRQELDRDPRSSRDLDDMKATLDDFKDIIGGFKLFPAPPAADKTEGES